MSISSDGYSAYTIVGEGSAAPGGTWSGTGTDWLGPWTAKDSGNDSTGLTSTSTGFPGGSSGSGDFGPYGVAGGSGVVVPDDGTGLMSIIEQDQLYWAYQPLNAIPVNVPNGSGVNYDEVNPVLAGTDLYLEGGRVAGGGGYYGIPTSPSLKASAGAYVGNMLYGYIDDTDSIIPDGLPTQAATALGNMAENTSPSDGVSRSWLPSSTSTLITLAAAGRNPTDITLPTAGTEAVDPPGQSHLDPDAVPYVEGALPMSLRPALWGPGAAQQVVASNSVVLRPGVNTVNYDPYGTLQQSRMAALEDSSGMGSPGRGNHPRRR